VSPLNVCLFVVSVYFVTTQSGNFWIHSRTLLIKSKRERKEKEKERKHRRRMEEIFVTCDSGQNI
jgi:hypothetical protein